MARRYSPNCETDSLRDKQFTQAMLGDSLLYGGYQDQTLQGLSWLDNVSYAILNIVIISY